MFKKLITLSFIVIALNAFAFNYANAYDDDDDEFKMHLDLRAIVGFSYFSDDLSTLGQESIVKNLGYNLTGQLIVAIFPNLGVGIDFAYLKTTPSVEIYGITILPKSLKEVEAFNTSLFVNVPFFYETFFLQAGLGLYYFPNNDSNNQFNFGMLTGLGADIQMVGQLYFTILFKVDYVFTEDMLFPINVNAGLTYRFTL